MQDIQFYAKTITCFPKISSINSMVQYLKNKHLLKPLKMQKKDAIQPNCIPTIDLEPIKKPITLHPKWKKERRLLSIH